MMLRKHFILAPLVVAIAACSDSTDFDFEGSQASYEQAYANANPPVAAFDPSADTPVIPFPNNVLFTPSEGQTPDGTLNIPVADPNNLADPSVAMNQLNGFSTTAPISTPVAKALDPASLRLGDTVRVFEVSTTPQGAVTGINGEVTAGIAVTQTGGQLVLLPLVPLKPATQYMVLLTNGITDADGNGLARSTIYGFTAGSEEITISAALEGLRQLTGTQLAAAAGAGINAADVSLSWTFRTQSIREVLQAAEDQASASTITVAPTGLNTNNINEALPGLADVYIGTMQLPYYLDGPSETDPTAAVNGYWLNASGGPVGAIGASGTYEYAPQVKSTVTVPVLMTIPNANSATAGVMPEGGWPITIFQHGITGNRTQMLALADAMANGGRAVIAIDQPMHGLTDNTLPLHADNTPFPNDQERHFGLDLQNNETGAAGPDGNVDGSGSAFINLQNLANSRDNLRQAVADLMTLSASVGSIVGEGVTINPANKTFVGHSLGGIAGNTLLSYDDTFSAGSLVFSGGGIPYLLAASDSFGPRIRAGLAAAGIEAGSAQFNQFLLAAQTVVDSADPINHAPYLVGSGPAINLVEVRGDAVIPNAVETAPLAGTEPLQRVMQLPQIDATASGSNFIIFSEGDHGTVLSPAASEAATRELQTQIVTFAATGGQQLPVNNASVIEAVPSASQ